MTNESGKWKKISDAGDLGCGFFIIAGLVVIGLPLVFRLWKWGFGF